MAAADSRIPTVIGDRYRVEQRIGRGGMAEVYLARDVRADELVALKFLRPELIKDKRRVKRFAVEVAAHRRAVDPNVVQLRDAGVAEQLPYLVMDWVRGPSLFDWVRHNGPLAPRLALRRFREVALGLAAMHDADILHRDVKPANILLDVEDETPTRARVSDLGLARFASVRGITRTGTMLGSPSFMAPEQVVADEVDPRTDVYGWGMSLFFAITGQLPFEGKTLPVMVHQLRSVVPPPSWLVEDCGEQLDAIVASAVRKLPGNRYPSLADAARDAAAALGAEPGAAVGVAAQIHPDEYTPQTEQARRWLEAVALEP